MRQITSEELKLVAGGEVQTVVVTRKKDEGSTLPAGSVRTSLGGSVGSIGGGGGSARPTTAASAQPASKLTCTTEQAQECVPGGITKFSFGLSGVSMEQSVGGCKTTIKETCVGPHSSK
jgi:hypothetical protein